MDKANSHLTIDEMEILKAHFEKGSPLGIRASEDEKRHAVGCDKCMEEMCALGLLDLEMKGLEKRIEQLLSLKRKGVK